ncbi:MAG: hypothetical protein WD099_09590 [Dongiaceae bacterium]
MAATDIDLCARLESVVRRPSALPLPEFEEQLSQFFGHYCHRNAAAGWVRDKYVRDAGPFIASLRDGAWVGKDFGTHSPVVIWYSPEMAAWMKANRPAIGEGPASPPVVPDGAVMVKEMYPAPTSLCRDVDPLKLFPTHGAAIMIRDNAASYDGWFWGWYGFGSDSGWAVDWPPPADSPVPNMGFAQACLNCHASAEDNLTFAASKNMEGEPGRPLTYLSQDFFSAEPPVPRHKTAVAPDPMPRIGQPLSEPDRDVIAALRAYAQTMPAQVTVSKMPSEAYDNTWVAGGGPTAADTFLTSSQCIGCHDAGSTGLQFDMTQPNPHGDNLINLSPFATWRSSPMGLGGRDPIFFAQLASETQTFHPEVAGLVEDVCLSCHGVAGHRQFHIDRYEATGECQPFTRAMVDAVPWPIGNPGAEHANYGALARDGITCTACHRMLIGDEEGAAVKGEAQNACMEERQALFNPGHTGFGATFTGTFFVAAPDALIGPFEKPAESSMVNALGIKPVFDNTITSSEMCGTCHTIHLPVFHEGKGIGRVYEQTTYAEWAFSAYRTGATAEGNPLPLGAGAVAQSCQSCHMPDREADGSLTRSKIASVQETLNFPEVEHGDGPDLEVREGFSRHTLVGLNVFLVKMAQQFPEILGIRTRDPNLGSLGVDPLETTEEAILEQAANETAAIAVHDVAVDAGTLSATVTVTSKTGHKFPSGVGFRRAFVAFDVLDQNGETIWASGRTNAAGVIVDAANEPIDGELWWKDDCLARAQPGERPHQPHFTEIARQDQAQIYQELVSAPPAGATAPVCGHGVEPTGELTTSFLSICADVKDNRILPKGYLSATQRREIAAALGVGDSLADESGSSAIGDDPDYVGGGGDSLTYRVPLADLPAGRRAASVAATLYYQAVPPFYLQDRFCTAKGSDVERLNYLVGHLNLAETEAEGWKLKVVETGPVAVPGTP